ncbi:MAG: DNA polymerase IV [Erysipelotrichaceae bacterium]|nr:DNA polymerase IV [Erysipelotrichaceae bacterium]
MGKVIFHIDLNAFFANAELLHHPELKGKPIAVSGNTRRSVVSTCSYEARAFGVHSAMPISEAKALCKDLIIVEGNHEYYEELSARFMALIRSYTTIVEQASIDECYADMSVPIQKYQYPLDLAWEIQKRLLKELGLPCSIGVAPNKFLAKMASDMKKPLGITVLRISEVPTKLWPLPIKDMRGIGTKTLKVMQQMDIKTIGELAHYEDKEALKRVFGKNTEHILRLCHGRDDSELVCEWDAKSYSQSTTFLEDIYEYDEIKGGFNYLARKLATRLYEDDKMGKNLSITIKYHDFKTMNRSIKLDQAIYRQDDLLEEALRLFDANWNDEPIRLLGIGIGSLSSIREYNKQLNLFGSDDPIDKTLDVIASLNEQLSIPGLKLASSILKESK